MAEDDGLDGLDGLDGEDLYYLPEDSLKGIKEKLKAEKPSEEDLKPLLEKILDPSKLDDQEMLLPVDMRGIEKDFDGIDELVEELGTVEAAKALLKAREYFEANKDGKAEGERPLPMTATEWRKILQEDMEEDLLEEDEEGLLEAGEEESDEEDPEEAEAEEPAAKKAKTG
ncbi:unnamed protein product [Effrenium voratum]|uniref:Uncharacterized protein n=1 Tax=Effrenium voratum TaxID=2562239 RepID=A0AA36NJ41_9DINO|nr:unnamed protein product [Effrenium voratum]CAJ1408994.1 unnamed protein product [Effrenium voratum]CAJ1417363.1 unnamed protein product [Effrenium voratum]